MEEHELSRWNDSIEAKIILKLWDLFVSFPIEICGFVATKWSTVWFVSRYYVLWVSRSKSPIPATFK